MRTASYLKAIRTPAGLPVTMPPALSDGAEDATNAREIEHAGMAQIKAYQHMWRYYQLL
jgi:hypothetical protein